MNESRWSFGRRVRIARSGLRRAVGGRSLRLVQLSWAAVNTAFWTATIGLAVIAYAAGGSTAVALAVLARAVPGVVLGPLVGPLVDRGSRRRVMLLASLVSAAACAAAAAAGTDVLVVTVLVALVSVATMVFRAAHAALLPELVERPADLTSANGVTSAVEAFGVFTGPALAGLLLAVQGPQLALGVSAGLLVMAALLLVGRGSGRESAARRTTGSVSTVRALLRLPAARLLLGLVLAQTVLSGALLVLYPALSLDVLDAGEAGVGLLVSAFGLGGLIGSVGLFALAGSSRLGALTSAALAVWSLPLLLLAALPELGLALALAMLALVGAANVLFDVTLVTLLQRAVPEHLLGRAFGAVETVVVVGLGAGAVIAPALAFAVGPAQALAAVAGPLLVVAVLALRPLLRLDHDLMAPTRQIALLRGLPPFAGLAVPELERLALSLHRVERAGGQDVVRQGEPGRSYWVLETGRLTVRVDGRAVARLGPGEAFGEVALLRDGTRTATVTADGPAVLWTLDGQVFLDALGGPGSAALDATGAVVQAYLLRAAPGSDPDAPSDSTGSRITP